MGQALVDVVGDVPPAEVIGGKLAQRQGDHPGDVAGEGRGDQIGEGIEALVVGVDGGGSGASQVSEAMPRMRSRVARSSSKWASRRSRARLVRLGRMER